MHVARAFELLEDLAVKAEIEARGPAACLNESFERWQKLKDDDRLPKIEHFRDKYTAHLGQPNPQIILAQFQELFSFVRETTELLGQLARATGARTEGLDTWDYQAREAPWSPEARQAVVPLCPPSPDRRTTIRNARKSIMGTGPFSPDRPRKGPLAIGERDRLNEQRHQAE
jgi:hypothetical protein